MDEPRAEIDTSRPFRSVKEAVAIFGERFLARELHALKTNTGITTTKHVAPLQQPAFFHSPSFSSQSFSSFSHHNQEREDAMMATTMKRLEDELEETKREVMLLKERESEMEAAVASLNAELQRSSTKWAEAEEARDGQRQQVESGRFGSFEHLPTLAEVLSFGEIECEFEEEKRKMKRERKLRKKKPIVPLVGDLLFPKKKGPPNHQFSIYSPPFTGVVS